LGAAVAGIGLGIMTEVLQHYIPGRNMDVYDGMADIIGLFVGIFICYKSKLWFNRDK